MINCLWKETHWHRGETSSALDWLTEEDRDLSRRIEKDGLVDLLSVVLSCLFMVIREHATIHIDIWTDLDALGLRYGFVPRVDMRQTRCANMPMVRIFEREDWPVSSVVTRQLRGYHIRLRPTGGKEDSVHALW